MKHKDYWRKRFEQLEEAQNNKSVKYYLELEKQYKLAMNSIEKDILAWYNRFAKNEGISLLEAKKLLNTRELEEFKWSVEEYIRHGKENAINQKWMKELENASARVHITRLEALKLQIQQQVEVLYGNELDGIDKLMRDIYTSGYYHTAFNV
ncbi:phage head morphogenesis protein, partial [Clostridioides difficile]|nr:phage head morphogenesis protein [Clostridioides difficile]